MNLLTRIAGSTYQTNLLVLAGNVRDFSEYQFDGFQRNVYRKPARMPSENAVLKRLQSQPTPPAALTAPSAYDEEMLDIPAFLRAQPKGR